MNGSQAPAIDPIRYEIFIHRLFQVVEEGRLAMKMVSGSPVVVEGGETMNAIYKPDGTPILVAAGILLHCVGAMDFIKRCMEWYQDDPGIFEGDQFFFNDPYIGGQHLPDYVIIKPIFFKGRHVAWTGSIMHTPACGGIGPAGMPTESKNIYEEGIRILGLKIIEKGKFRPDVFRTIVQQTEAPHLVGLDTKAKIAANNVVSRRFVELLGTYGEDFVNACCDRIIADSEAKSRAKLRSLPDGVWRSRSHCEDSSFHQDAPFKVVCTMTKKSDEVTFDFTGSSPQLGWSNNEALPGTWGSLYVAMASQLFWDVPWNGGMFAPVHVIAPEGSVVNCRFPASVGNGVITSGMMITNTAHECIAKMFFAGGLIEDVNAGWASVGGGPYLGGLDRNGEFFAGVILDNFGAGCGATPVRDGVDCGAQMMNPQSNINDLEVAEQYLPLLSLGRRETPDSGGYGKFQGGLGPESSYVMDGTPHVLFGLQGGGRRAAGSFGMFGGYPNTYQQRRFAFNTRLDEAFSRGWYPTTPEEMEQVGECRDVPAANPAIPLKHYDLHIYNMSGGGGYGDPLERDPQRVLTDLQNGKISPGTARLMYGVMCDQATTRVLPDETAAQRRALRERRRQEGRVTHQWPGLDRGDVVTEMAIRFHESLEVVNTRQGRKVVRCRQCGQLICDAHHDYKEHVLLRVTDLTELPGRQLRNGDKPFTLYQEYACPGCALLLEVDTFCPEIDGEDPIVWDIQLDL